MTTDHSGETEADPIEGYAFFDGLFFKTDSFCDPNWDRVMPILEEEQVFMCRQMAGRILQYREEADRPLNILDVGSGSGIFAIYLDRLLNRDSCGRAVEEPSLIVALDSSSRALDFIGRNCRLNNSVNVLLGDSDDTGEPQEYDTGSADESSQDIVLINPPYQPVPPYDEWTDRLALHGDGGEDGLEVFRNWLPSIRYHLKRGGILIGSVMSPIRSEGTSSDERDSFKPVALEEMCEAFRRRCDLRFLYHLDKSKSPRTGEFLENVYRDYIEKSRRIKTLKEGQDRTEWERDIVRWGEHIAEWINDRCSKSSRVGVLYFEMEKGSGDGIAHENLCPYYEGQEPLPSFHNKPTWQKRTRIHRLMANNIQEYPGQLPTNAVINKFSFPFPTNPNYNTHEQIEHEDVSALDQYQKAKLEDSTLLSDVRRYLYDSGLLEHFDFILVDPTPLVPGIEYTLPRVDQEAAAWSNVIRPSARESMLGTYKQTVKTLHRKGHAPFFHPCIMTPRQFSGWRSGYLSKIQGHELCWEVRSTGPESLARLEKAYRGCVRNGHTDLVPVYSLFGDDTSFSTEKLTELPRMGDSEHFSGTFDWRRFLKTFSRRLDKHENLTVTPEMDFQALHWTIHRCLHERICHGDLQMHSEQGTWTSHYMALPLQLPETGIPFWPGTLSEAQIQSAALPSGYFGAIWVLVGKLSPRARVDTRGDRQTLMHFGRHLISLAIRNYAGGILRNEAATADAQGALQFLGHETSDILDVINPLSERTALRCVQHYLKSLVACTTEVGNRGDSLIEEFVQGENLCNFVRDKVRLAADLHTLCQLAQKGDTAIRDEYFDNSRPNWEALLNQKDAESLRGCRRIDDSKGNSEAKIRLFQFAAACVSAIRNILKNWDFEPAPPGQLRAKLRQDGLLVFRNPCDNEAEFSSDWGTENSLRYCVHLYGGNPEDAIFRFEKKTKQWVTGLPLPVPSFRSPKGR